MMLKSNHTLILSLFLTFGQILAQEGLPFYNHYLVSDKYLINPSYAGANPDILSVRGTYRNQWDDLPDSPNTQTLSAHATVVDRLAAGIYIFNDQNGLTSLRGVNLSAAYHIPIGDRYSGTGDKFSFGLSYNGFQQVFDFDRVIVTDPNDPLLNDDTYFLHYFNLGVSFNIGNFYGGLSVLDIPLVDNIPIANAIEPLPTWYYLLGGMKLNVADGIQLEPSFVMNLNSNSERHLDLNLMANFNNGEYSEEGQGLSLGVSYRQDLDSKGAQQLSISPLIKLGFGQFRLGASYDIGLSDLATEAGNGLLFSLGYDFGNPFNPDLR